MFFKNELFFAREMIGEIIGARGGGSRRYARARQKLFTIPSDVFV